VIAAGGTGGHFFPAEALASALLARGERVVLMTDARSGGLASLVFASCETHVIAGAGLSGRSVLRAAKGVAALAQGVGQARKILKDLRPAAVVAFGGYPAVAPVLAAASLRDRPRIVLHEQNAVLGRANRLLARFCDTLVLSFEKTSAVPRGITTVLLGNPVRPAVAALHGLPYVPPEERIRILVLGGSLGAKIFSTLIPQAFALLPLALRHRITLTMQCREAEMDAANEVLRGLQMVSVLASFFNDVAEKMNASHLMIARAGASTVAEVAVAGLPAIFIPLPNAIDDHQRANADALAELGAAWRLDQAGLTPQMLATRIETLLMNPTLLVNAAAAAARAGRPNAAEKLADLVLHGVTP
jgi:UDP-N-acetylglucosamine--N-acetylmuramyl-(pentapeptide) pyrophosphoryl-undecaprenol N-acetylglucosamine transferase